MARPKRRSAPPRIDPDKTIASRARLYAAQHPEATATEIAVAVNASPGWVYNLGLGKRFVRRDRAHTLAGEVYARLGEVLKMADAVYTCQRAIIENERRVMENQMILAAALGIELTQKEIRLPEAPDLDLSQVSYAELLAALPN